MSGEERGKGEERGQEARMRSGEGRREEPAQGGGRLLQRPRPLQAQPLAVRVAAGRQQAAAAEQSSPGKQQVAVATRPSPEKQQVAVATQSSPEKQQGPAPGKQHGAAGGPQRDGGGPQAGGGARGGPNQHDDIRQSLWVRRPDLFYGQPNQGGARAAFAEPPVPARQEVLAEAGAAPAHEQPRAREGGQRDAHGDAYREARDAAGVAGGAVGAALVQDVAGSPVPLTPEAGEPGRAGGGGRLEAAPELRTRPRLRLTTPLPRAPQSPRGGRAGRRAGGAPQEGGGGGRKGSSGEPS